MRIRRWLACLLGVALLATMSLTALAAPDGAQAKYVFFFIGDGMGFAQINTAEIFAQRIEEPDAMGVRKMAFTQFPYTGSVTTYDAESFCPDSASTGTSYATGNKTLGGVVNMDVTKTIAYPIITRMAKDSGYKVGVVSTVSIDHATPACFYANQASRGDYYDIGLQLVNSGFDFFGGGTFLQPAGKDGDKEDLFEIAKANGFAIPETREEILALDSASGRVFAPNPVIGDAAAMLYEIDRIHMAPDSLSLADYTRKAIDVLDNEDGFFLMIEGGKIDWACHANDAAASMRDVIALSDAVQVAVEFAEAHPGETLIVVTGDHETGGMTIGFAATGYSTFFEKTIPQDISFVEFDHYVARMRGEGISFEDAMLAVRSHFGLIAPDAPEAADEANAGMVLSPFECERLLAAYEQSMIPAGERGAQTEEQAVLYGTYEPFSVTVTHILNNKAGIGWTSYAHTGIPIPVFAMGAYAENFGGAYDNTDVFHKLVAAMGL